MADQEMPVPLPHCPHCDFELAAPSLFSWQHGAWVVFCVFCPECRASIGLHILPAIAAAAVVSASQESGSPIIQH